jgi:hypothetical protein
MDVRTPEGIKFRNVATAHAQNWSVKILVEGPGDFTVSAEKDGTSPDGSPCRGPASVALQAVVRWLEDAGSDPQFEIVVQRAGGAIATLITPRRNVALFFVATTLERSGEPELKG